MVVVALHCYFSHGYKIIIKSHMGASIIILHIPAIKPRRDWTRPAVLVLPEPGAQGFACVNSCSFQWDAWRAYAICIAGNYISHIPLTTGFQVDLIPMVEDWGQDKTRIFLLVFASKEAFNTGCCVCCLFMQFQAHSLGSQLLQNSACHTANFLTQWLQVLALVIYILPVSLQP